MSARASKGRITYSGSLGRGVGWLVCCNRRTPPRTLALGARWMFEHQVFLGETKRQTERNALKWMTDGTA